MEIVRSYFDYNISDKCLKNGCFDKIALRLSELGYHTIAVNQTIEESNLETSKKKKKKNDSRDSVNDIVPPPIDLKQYDVYKDLRIFNRLTIVFSNQDIINKIIKSSNYKKYHIIALMPMSQQAFQFSCSSMEGDILTFDPESKLNYKISRKHYSQLVDKGFHFEILYSPAIQDSSQRKNCISNAHMYHTYGKSKNIILSSGATQDYLLRSPYDIINLGLIFGLSEQQAKNAMSCNGRSVYIHSVGRRHGKTIMLVENINHSLKEVSSNSESGSEDEEMELDQPAQKKSKQLHEDN